MFNQLKILSKVVGVEALLTELGSTVKKLNGRRQLNCLLDDLNYTMVGFSFATQNTWHLTLKKFTSSSVSMLTLWIFVALN